MLKRLFSKTSAHQLRIEPGGESVTVAAGETLLQAALKAGLNFPNECRVGGCGRCKCRLLEGKIKPLLDFAYVLDREDLDTHHILACQAQPKSDVVVRVALSDQAAPKTIAGEVSRVKPLTRDIAEVRIQLAEPVSYTAGQYARLKLGDVEDSRAYSFANAPADAGDETVVFHVRRIDGGEVSPKLTTDAAVGMELEVQAPSGDFGLADGDHRMLCIAGGSGMAPLKSILEQVINDGKERTAVYLYGARTQADLYPPDVMASIQRRWPGTLTFVPVLSEEPQSSDWSGARGMVTEYITAQAGFNPEHCHAYLCGPPAMIDAAIGVLESHGMPGTAIHFDKFTDRRHVPES